MAPNVELRGRNAAAQAGSNEASSLKQVKSTQLLGTEVSIDGLVYDISDFNHPGGEVIKMFGGNDVTVQYKMIHAHHSKKHLEKMRVVGRVTDYEAQFKFGTPFERDVKAAVLKIVPRGKEYGTPGFFLRAGIYMALLAIVQIAFVYYGSSIPLAIVFGVVQAWIGLNVQHDANHGAASKTPLLNDVLGFGTDFIGGSKYTWLEQHWTHHAYTNHQSWDPDAFSAEPLLLFNNYPPHSTRRKAYHSLQALYFLPALSFYWVTSVFNPQIIDLKHRGAMAVGQRFDNAYVAGKRGRSVLLRVLYILANVISPFLHHGVCWTPVLHIWLFSTVESLLLSVLFSLSHNFQGVDRDPTKSFRETGQPVCWFKAQVETSSTYGGVLAGWLTGGLNFQIEHHLFPKMSSAWYPYIAPAVREVCLKHGVRYTYYPWPWQNFAATVKYIHLSGTGGHWERQPLSGK